MSCMDMNNLILPFFIQFPLCWKVKRTQKLEKQPHALISVAMTAAFEILKCSDCQLNKIVECEHLAGRLKG